MMLAFLEGLQFVVEGIEKYKLISTQFECQFLHTLSTKMKVKEVIFVRLASKIRSFTMFVIIKHVNRLSPYKISQP